MGAKPTWLVHGREDEEAKQKAVMDAAEALERRKEEKAAALGPAPQRGAPGTTQVRLRLKDGSSHQRCFSAQDPLQVGLSYQINAQTIFQTLQGKQQLLTTS